jgi:hypothetical protein
MAAWPIQFHTDAKPGIKRKVDPLPHVDKKKKYEETRKRLFLESWTIFYISIKVLISFA